MFVGIKQQQNLNIMKDKTKKILLIVFLFVILSPNLLAQKYKLSISDIIDNFINKYLEYNTIQYKEFNFSNGEPIANFDLYFEKATLDTNIGLKFEVLDNNSKTVYNGSELFVIGLENIPNYLQKNEYETIEITKPFQPVMGYANSYPAYAKALQSISKDKEIKCKLLKDTIINGFDCYSLFYHFKNKRILGDTIYNFPKSVNISFDLTLFIDKENYLLIQVINSNSFGSTILTEYKNYVFNKNKTNILWNLKDYKILKKYEKYEYKLIKRGAKVPIFKAITLSNKNVDQSILDNKISLLFFWRIGCSASKKTNTIINNIANKNPQISVFGINNWDNDISKIKLYKENENLKFKILIGNGELAKAFGVNASPTILIFDKTNTLKYVYKGYRENLESDIEKALKLIGEK